MALYQKLEYELELITPAFIGGAFPENQAELRPSSFIGILRWWFRNLALTVTGDIDSIYQLESELFGNTKRAGKVWVRLEPFKTFPYRIINETYQQNDILYIGFGNFMYLTYKNLREKRKYTFIYEYLRKHGKYWQRGVLNIKSYSFKEKFKLSFLLPWKYSVFIETLISLLDISGTIGSRNRRGWGSIKVLKGLNKYIYEIYPDFTQNLLQEINYKSPPRQGILITVFPKRIFESEYQLLKTLGSVYKSYRKSLDPSKRKYLGSANPRRGSPFIFKITPTPKGYFLTVTYIVNRYFHREFPGSSREFCETNVELLKSLENNFGKSASVYLKNGKVQFLKKLENLELFIKEDC